MRPAHSHLTLRRVAGVPPRQYKGSGAHSFSGCVATRPECAILIASIVTEWSNAEGFLSFAFGVLVFKGQEPQPTPDGKHSTGERIVKQALELANTFNQKRNVFLTAVKLRLGQAAHERMKPYLKRLNDLAEKRNYVAHGRWSIDQALPRDLVWNRSIVDEEPMLYTPETLREIFDEIAKATLEFQAAFLSELSPEAKALAQGLIQPQVLTSTNPCNTV